MISATLRPASASELIGAAFSSVARFRTRSRSALDSSAPVRKWLGKVGSVRSARMRLRVLTWNLMHGRSVPPAGRDLFDEFAGALAGWEWDAALLQEVPPWWAAELCARIGCDQRTVLTSRNALLSLR